MDEAPQEQPSGDEALREEDVTREDRLDDKVNEEEELPAAGAGTAEGEDNAEGTAPADSGTE